MKGIRFYLALYGAKLFTKVLRVLHRNGTHNPGVLALKICPDSGHYRHKRKDDHRQYGPRYPF